MKISIGKGRLTRDPKSVTNQDFPRTLATIAVQVRGHGGQEITEFVDLIADGHLAPILKSKRKGDTIFYSGSEWLKSYHTRENKPDKMNEVYLHTLDNL
jgi:hypothetical protein